MLNLHMLQFCNLWSTDAYSAGCGTVVHKCYGNCAVIMKVMKSKKPQRHQTATLCMAATCFFVTAACFSMYTTPGRNPSVALATNAELAKNAHSALSAGKSRSQED